MSKSAIVYGLYSSRKPDELRYVGQTTQGLSTRLNQHRNYSKNKKTAVHKWFNREVLEGFEILIKILLEGAVFNVTEQEVIAKHKLSGARLLNLTDGGEGTLGWHGGKGIPKPWMVEQNKRVFTGKTGHPMSAENKAKLLISVKNRNTDYLSERNRNNPPFLGKKHTDEWKYNARNRVMSEETKRKISSSLTGRIFSDEWKRKIGESAKGRIPSDETKQKIRLAMLGRIVSSETRKKLSKKRNMSESGRAAIIATHKGKIVSEETRIKMKKSAIDRWTEAARAEASRKTKEYYAQKNI